MTSADRLSRSYSYVAVDAPATSDTVVALLRLAADRMSGLGLVDVHDITFSTSVDKTSPSSGLTIYYDRIERRREDR